MTLQEVYQQGKKFLEQAGIESPAFDAICLFHKVFGMDRQALILKGNEAAHEEKAEIYAQLIRLRAEKKPLQYLLGSWEFMDFSLKVGEGVLIPREETELLVYTAVNKWKQDRCKTLEKPVVVDLCAGTGAVGIGIYKLLPTAEVFCVEKYEKALFYLQENILQHGDHIHIVTADVLSERSVFLQSWAQQTGEFLEQQGIDLLVSNPPYIAQAELETLQEEVKREPQTALDGGKDGLKFYRAIVENWLPFLKKEGIIVVEIGQDQGSAVSNLFQQASLKEIEVWKDFNGLDRVVSGINKI